jgi:ADP-ribose pyrophosphatase YjhB (NUDIX family)
MTAPWSGRYRVPALTVDVIIEVPEGGVVLVRRKNPPQGWALPGGYVDYGETLERAAVREAGEETGLEIQLRGQLHTYSDPRRDPRRHTVTTVFVATARGTPTAGDDAEKVRVFSWDELPDQLAFDHADILQHYRTGRWNVPR